MLNTFILKHLGHEASDFVRRCQRPMETSKESFGNANLFTWWSIMFCSMTAHISFGYLFYYEPNFCIHGLSADQVLQTRHKPGFTFFLYSTTYQLGCNINALIISQVPRKQPEDGYYLHSEHSASPAGLYSCFCCMVCLCFAFHVPECTPNAPQLSSGHLRAG